VINDYPIPLPVTDQEIQEKIDTLRRHKLVTSKVDTLYTGSYIIIGLIVSSIIVFSALRQRIRRCSTLGEERKEIDNNGIHTNRTRGQEEVIIMRKEIDNNGIHTDRTRAQEEVITMEETALVYR
jgi:hypothetical protein